LRTIYFVGPWAAPRPISDMVASLDQAALRRFVGGLSKAEFDRFWAALVAEGDIPPADPKQALLWHARREQLQRFKEWFSTLDLPEMSKAYLAFVAGTPVEEICPWLQTSQLSNEKLNG